MCSGVCPAVVVELALALCSKSSFTISSLPIRAAQCSGVWSSCGGKGSSTVMKEIVVCLSFPEAYTQGDHRVKHVLLSLNSTLVFCVIIGY